jgi:hypothetical protein
MESVERLELRGILERVKAVHLGVDVGQKSDYSAIVVVEVGERATQQTYTVRGHRYSVPEATYKVQHLARLPLGTPFRAVAAEVVNLVGGLWQWETDLRKAGAILPYEPGLPWDVWMDATGLGLPVVELVKTALAVSPKTDRATVHPVVFTHGDRYVRGGYEQTGDVLGKAYLVSRLQVLFEQRTLSLPKHDLQIDAMVEELKAYEIRIDADANDKYGAFAVGAHDDMVTALGLACLEDPGYYQAEQGPRIW